MKEELAKSFSNLHKVRFFWVMSEIMKDYI